MPALRSCSFSSPAVCFVFPAAADPGSGKIADRCKSDISATPSW
nr:MAG TPA_asm: hypothetical protein [Caudoviricetes sp.]